MERGGVPPLGYATALGYAPPLAVGVRMSHSSLLTKYEPMVSHGVLFRTVYVQYRYPVCLSSRKQKYLFVAFQWQVKSECGITLKG